MYFTYTYEELKHFCEDAFQRFGFNGEEAAIITDVLDEEEAEQEIDS